MKFLVQMQQVFDYIENNLENDIDIKALGNILAINEDTFKRTFNLVFGMPITEYIKKRRLTMCVKDLEKMNVLDVAVKYGYSSQEGFSRAFKSFYGFLPSEYQRGEKLNAFLPFECNFAEFNHIEYSIEAFDKLTLFGVKKTCKIAQIGEVANEMWKKYKSDFRMSTRYGIVEYLRGDMANYWIASSINKAGYASIDTKAGDYLVFELDKESDIKAFSNAVWQHTSKELNRQLGDMDIEIYTPHSIKLAYKLK